MTFLPRTMIIAFLCALTVSGSGCAQTRPAKIDCAAKIGVAGTIFVGAGHPPLTEQLQPGQVVLSFDDGPAGQATVRVLDVLDAHCTRAVFFLQGDKAERDPKLVAHIAARGHAIGSHSYDHANLAGLSVAEAEANMLRGRDAVNAPLKTAATLFRFPFLASSPALSDALTRLGLIEIGVEADGEDWTGNSPEDRVSRIMDHLESKNRKGVILLHDPYPQSAETVDLLLTRLKEDGYQLIDVRVAPER